MLKGQQTLQGLFSQLIEGRFKAQLTPILILLRQLMYILVYGVLHLVSRLQQVIGVGYLLLEKGICIGNDLFTDSSYLPLLQVLRLVRFNEVIGLGQSSGDCFLPRHPHQMLEGMIEIGQRPRINYIHIGLRQLSEQLPIQSFIPNSLGSDFLQYLIPQIGCLLQKLRSKFVVGEGVELLEFVLIFNGSNHGETVSISKEVFNCSTYSIFILNGV